MGGPAPVSALFVSDLQVCVYFLLKEHLLYIILQRSKVIKKSQNSRNKDFSRLFCLLMEESGSGAGARFGSGSVQINYGSRCGSRRPKNIRILRIWMRLRIRNTVDTCTALPKAEFVIEPPPDTQQRRRQRGIGITRGSYLLLTSLSPLPPHPPHRAPAALPGAALSGLAERRPPPLLIVHPPWPKLSDFQERRLKRRTASISRPKSDAAEFGQLLWFYTNLNGSDRTLMSRVRFLTFLRKEG